MTSKKDALSPQLEALKTTDLSLLIRLSGAMAPRLLGTFLPKLTEQQRNAFAKAMPAGGKKQLYVHLVGTPTPPVVIEMAQPLRIGVVPEAEVGKQRIRGIRLVVEDLQALSERRWPRLLWRLKGQAGPLLRLVAMFVPFLWLGPRGLMDLKKRAMTHFRPLLDLLPRRGK